MSKMNLEEIFDKALDKCEKPKRNDEAYNAYKKGIQLLQGYKHMEIIADDPDTAYCMHSVMISWSDMTQMSTEWITKILKCFENLYIEAGPNDWLLTSTLYTEMESK